ncbi:porin family protein [Vibrio sp. ZSDE26]|uniref:Porin family protein n=1 Tax=Vibrio amylolyticus TaxID=2847292 RepID=A0A9X2BKT4_9VIBR|nr:outer membrane beta-barrel protein [Vibrio amylolyticus]MCK6263198.1 porin family protein [Vibrio amylolyticus]
MKKVIGLALLAAVSAPSAFATSVNYFAGGGFGSHYSEMKGYGTTLDDRTGAFHIRGGAYINDVHRVTLTGNFAGDAELFSASGNVAGDDISINGELNQNEWLASYDYVHAINNEFSVFGGVSAGFVKNKTTISWDINGTPDSDSHSETDFAVGAQVGVQYTLTKELSIDGTYRNMGKSLNEDGIKVTGSEFAISLDYRF